MKLRVTVGDVMAWGPCDDYEREDVQRLFGRRKYMTADQILDLDIPIEDRLWAVLREELLAAPVLREFACRCAERALRRERAAGRKVDTRLWEAVRMARRYARGKATDEELAAARDAAWDAARDAAWDAARDAAWDAARDAARAAAWDAARDAAWDAARDAAWDAARGGAMESERKWQLKCLQRLMRSWNKIAWCPKCGTQVHVWNKRLQTWICKRCHSPNEHAG